MHIFLLLVAFFIANASAAGVDVGQKCSIFLLFFYVFLNIFFLYCVLFSVLFQPSASSTEFEMTNSFTTGIFRSEEMNLCHLFLQPSIVFDVTCELGDLGS